MLLLLSFGLLSAQELIFEQYPQRTDFLLLIPYNSINFRAGSTESVYQVSINLRNSRGRSLFSQTLPMEFVKQEWLKDTAIPYSFSRELAPGSYQMQIRLRNRSVGGNLELRRQFRISAEGTERGQAYLFARREGVTFIPPVIPEPSLLESLEMRQSFLAEPDSIGIISGLHRLTVRNPASPLVLDLIDLLISSQENALQVVFYEDNIRYSMEAFLYSQWFSYGQSYSLRDQINQLRYIATQNEWQVLRRVPNDQLADAIEQFWTLHDPSPGTLRNETRELFYQRVMTADERYTIHSRLKGWRSDRGRIYIKYGEPDEVRAEPLPLDSPPYVIWQYYTENLQFVFIDEGGFGRYTLRNSEDEY